MFVLKVVLCSFLSVLTLIILTKIIGARQISELSHFDYINGITIGSIAAEFALSTNFESGMSALVAMVTYGLVTVFLAFFTDKSMYLRSLINGNPLILMYDGQFVYENFKKARLDMSEFLIRARNNGYFDINEICVAVFETNGKVSFLPKSDYKNVSPDDLKLKIPQNFPVTDVILDGKIMKDNLSKLKRKEAWLFSKMKEQNISDVNEIFLATVNDTDEIRFYFKNKNENNQKIASD